MTKKIFFKHPLGTKLCGVIENPTDSLQKPIIIIAHGFITSSKDSGSYKQIIKNLIQANISVFRIDLFAHGESEGDFADITITKGKDSILAAIKHLKEKGYENIGLLGSSFGGISSIMAAADSNDLFCLALKSPVTDWRKIATIQKEGLLAKWKKDGWIDYKKGDSKFKLKFNIVEDAKNNVAFDVASKIEIPTLIVHGDQDEIVPYSGSAKFADLLSQGEIHTVNGANHNYSSTESHFKEMTQAISQFLIRQSAERNI